jgi:hypothetical protein
VAITVELHFNWKRSHLPVACLSLDLGSIEILVIWQNLGIMRCVLRDTAGGKYPFHMLSHRWGSGHNVLCRGDRALERKGGPREVYWSVHWPNNGIGCRGYRPSSSGLPGSTNSVLTLSSLEIHNKGFSSSKDSVASADYYDTMSTFQI